MVWIMFATASLRFHFHPREIILVILDTGANAFPRFIQLPLNLIVKTHQSIIAVKDGKRVQSLLFVTFVTDSTR